MEKPDKLLTTKELKGWGCAGVHGPVVRQLIKHLYFVFLPLCKYLALHYIYK